MDKPLCPHSIIHFYHLFTYTSRVIISTSINHFAKRYNHTLRNLSKINGERLHRLCSGSYAATYDYHISKAYRQKTISKCGHHIWALPPTQYKILVRTQRYHTYTTKCQLLTCVKRENLHIQITCMKNASCMYVCLSRRTCVRFY